MPRIALRPKPTVEGANGPDRIAKNGYDAADRVLTIKNAFATALEQTTVTNAYTANGKRDWVEDANGNRSDFTYDGHDRLTKLNFPSTTVGAHAANASDYEEYGYDPNGNMTSKRLRSTETIAFTFDVLNRETVKDIPGGTAADVYSGYDLLGRKLFAKFALSTSPSTRLRQGFVGSPCPAKAGDEKLMSAALELFHDAGDCEPAAVAGGVSVDEEIVRALLRFVARVFAVAVHQRDGAVEQLALDGA